MSKETDPPRIAPIDSANNSTASSLSHYQNDDFYEPIITNDRNDYQNEPKLRIPDDSPRSFLPKKKIVIKEKKPQQENPEETRGRINPLDQNTEEHEEQEPEEDQQQEEPEGKKTTSRKTKHKRLTDAQIRQFKKFVGNLEELKRLKVARMIMFTLIDVWGKAPFYIVDGIKIKKWGSVGICYDTNDYLARGEARVMLRCSERAVELALRKLSELKLIHVILHPKNNKYSRRSISPTKRALIRIKEYEKDP